ncbi:MAG: excinuclease ABC subunit UvrC [Tannerellaceae bacterium]|jgi:excinuclease ABC subunit C|nr:excinuclease ABC subunit UvrC [Tannerellaceae bacterium]
MNEKEIKSEKKNGDYKDYLNNILSIIPECPGCYQYFDEKEKIIYIGKAKNLKKRVHSYFNKNHDSIKTQVLVKSIRDIKYIVVDNEEDALQLENNLIKQYKPKFNSMLKDDKTYPSIVIKNEFFPRVFHTRNIIKDGSQYFGPYSSSHIVKIILQLIKDIYPIRNCNYPLTKEKIAENKYKVCLEYHMKRCKGPCEGLQNIEEYNNNIIQIKEILKGNISKIIKNLQESMFKYAEELKFEEAQIIKKKIDLIEKYNAKSKVVVPFLTNIDVFSYKESDNNAFINYMHIGNGAIVHVYTIEYKKKINESKEDILGLGIIEMRDRFKSTAKEIITPFIPNTENALDKILFTIPQRGDKKKLLDISEKNAKQYKLDKLKQEDKLNPEQKTTRLLSNIQKDLHMKHLPVHIECFDNSNIQGKNPVASCVVFKKGKAAKRDYRHFHIKSVEGPDDYASMEEVVTRRYSRALREGGDIPQLIIIDGGKGQLKVAANVLKKLGLDDRILIVGLAKRLEEIFFVGDPIPLILDKTSETLKLMQQIRDEAHRFGITFHRQLRSKEQTESILDSIKGIGESTKEKLLKKYKSIKRIKNTPLLEMQHIIGERKAKIILDALNELYKDNEPEIEPEDED